MCDNLLSSGVLWLVTFLGLCSFFGKYVFPTDNKDDDFQVLLCWMRKQTVKQAV